MDWSNVTGDELIDALREAEWTAPPRSPKEFFAKFSPPKTASKWTSRIKCNVYFYRSNYFIILMLCLVVAFYRNPVACFGTGLASFCLLCANDTFATAVSERIIRLIRKANAPLAAKMRNAGGTNLSSGRLGARSKGKVYMCGAPRLQVIGALTLVSGGLLYYSSAWMTIAGALSAAFGVILLHASFRTPNLKARIASAREEFRAVWRGYNDYSL
mmetsp:Transcript_31962/g.38646  ORF Transcript_31962/g.38646 Transcript_31962/m.38646 type:complete len:215 (+) Transcript_31962:279-923(+)